MNIHYHQVQLQLYVGMDTYHWHNLFIYTTKGVAVQRLSLDVEWCAINITELENYFDIHTHVHAARNSFFKTETIIYLYDI